MGVSFSLSVSFCALPFCLPFSLSQINKILKKALTNSKRTRLVITFCSLPVPVFRGDQAKLLIFWKRWALYWWERRDKHAHPPFISHRDVLVGKRAPSDYQLSSRLPTHDCPSESLPKPAQYMFPKYTLWAPQRAGWNHCYQFSEFMITRFLSILRKYPWYIFKQICTYISFYYKEKQAVHSMLHFALSTSHIWKVLKLFPIITQRNYIHTHTHTVSWISLFG